MSDEMFDRDYRAGRTALNATIALAVRKVARAISGAFEATHRVQFSAPWTARARPVRSH